MSSPNQTAEAILIVLKKIIKWIFFAVLVSFLALYAMIKIEAFWEWLTNGRYAEDVSIKFVKLAEDCDAEFPYLYVITNNSSKIVEETVFSVEIRREGYSNVINSYTSITNSKILKPKETTQSCFRATTTDYKSELIRDKNVDYTISHKRVSFSK